MVIQFLTEHFLDLIGVIVVIIIIVRMAGTFERAGRKEMHNQNSIAVMEEYRQWNQWDQRLVYAPDVLSAILQYRGDPDVAINEAGSDDTDWGDEIKRYTVDNTKDSDINSIYLEFEDSTKQYIAMLEKDVNGAVSCIHFVPKE